MVLRTKTNLPADTLHGIFQRLTGKDTDDRGREKLFFKAKHKSGSLAGQVVLLDEASMVDSRMMSDILDTDAQ